MDSFRISMLVVLALGVGRARYGRHDLTRPYNTFWDRFFAGWLDAIVLWPLSSANARIFGAGAPRMILAGWFTLYSFAFLFYQMFCHARWGQTFGKWAFGVRVLDLTEASLRPVQAVKRDAIALMLTAGFVVQHLIRGEYSATAAGREDILSVLSSVWGALEILTMLTNRKRRALHDIIAGSVVVRVVHFRRRKAVEPVAANDPAAGTFV